MRRMILIFIFLSIWATLGWVAIAGGFKTKAHQQATTNTASMPAGAPCPDAQEIYQQALNFILQKAITEKKLDFYVDGVLKYRFEMKEIQ